MHGPQKTDFVSNHPRFFLGMTIALIALIFAIAFGESSYKGWRLLHPTETLGVTVELFARLADFFYISLKYSLAGQIFGFFLSLLSVGAVFFLGHLFFSYFEWKRKNAERFAICGGLVWVFIAFNWISLMPVALTASASILVFLLLNNSNRWMPFLIDPASHNSRKVVLAFLGLMILNGFFWWPGYQLFVALGMCGVCVGDNVAALVGRRKGQRRFRFSKSGKTWEGTAAMFTSTFAFNIIIAVLMIHIPGMQKELFRFLIILLAAVLSTTAEALSPKGMDNILIGLATAFPIYFYIH